MLIAIAFDIISIVYHDILSLDGIRQSPTKGCTPMGGTMKEELKALIEKMNEEQFEWFIDQARRVLSEEAA